MHRHSPLRRLLLRAAALAPAVAALPATLWAVVVDRFRTRSVETDDFRFDPDTGSVVRDGHAPEPYALAVGGMVERPLSLSYKELRALPYREQTSDFHCVEGWSVHDVRWGGFDVAALARLARPLPGAKYVVFQALGTIRHGPLDHYVESLPLDDLLNPELRYLLALDLDGAPLPHDRGAPLRLAAPFDLGYKGIKFIRSVEFTATPRKGWWTLANPAYPWHAPVPAERLRTPSPRS